MSEVGLQFRLKPVARRRPTDAFTSAALSVSVDGVAVWPVADAPEASVEIEIDDLLSHLVEFWEPLALRQTYPLSISVERPTVLRAEAEARWEAKPAEFAEREDAALCDFEEAHDLSRCFGGLFDLPPFWLLRRGDKMIVDTRSGLRAVDFEQAWAEITRVGHWIASRLSIGDNRWSRLIANWRARDARDPMSMLAWSTGLMRVVAEGFERDGLLSAPADFAQAANDNDELRIAARMASALPPDQIRAILNLVVAFPKRAAPDLDALARDVAAHVADRFASSRAFVQGEAAARFVRERLGLEQKEPCDIAALLERLGIRLEFAAVEPSALRALAIDGPAHGPVALINMMGAGRIAGSNPRLNRSARVDMAHELCHLLLDRGHALGAVEILNSRMPVEIEQRAKSFAGELLAPTEAIAEDWRIHGEPRSREAVKALIFQLQQAYGVTKAVADWKLDHATRKLGVDLSILLDAIAPWR